jgi:hypothetical protein
MDRSKLVAVVTGVISLLLAIGYLVLVQLLDFRGDMVPAPISTVGFRAVQNAVSNLGSMVSLSFF